MGIRKALAIGAVVSITALGAIGCTPEDDDSGTKKDKSNSSSSSSSGGSGKDDRGAAKGDDKKKDADKSAAKGSQADRFKAFVNKNGTPKEKDAVSHVTKVQGADEVNDLLSTADVYTDYTGGIMGKGTGPAKLLASAFADWKKTDNGAGLVTIYDTDGELLGNGNF
ncbi:hypothetical protein [Streptomyces sp. NPDC005955]|jgi:hypothetical protein|uniref:hypothetical protein n=1 Tax=Streptomyces sp. NPDC005955 TaxID=3364738 RepID=UPI0036B6AA93